MMKTGGITAFDKRDFGLDLRFTHRTKEFFDAESNLNVQLEVLDAFKFIDYTVQMALSQMPSTGKYRKPSSARQTCIAIPGMWMPETVAAGEGAPEPEGAPEGDARGAGLGRPRPAGGGPALDAAVVTRTLGGPTVTGHCCSVTVGDSESGPTTRPCQ